MNTQKVLVVIPARGGSKGILKKNIKLLKNKPLILYSIDVAKSIVSSDNICISTDDDEIINLVESYGTTVPFKRPPELATDTASTNDVLLHAISYYESKDSYYDIVILLQPTSPLRTALHVKNAMLLYNQNIDMVVSVRESHAPAVLCKENETGYLEDIFNKDNLRRQDIPVYYEYDGSIYIINIKSLKENGLAKLKKKIKYIMPIKESIDIDNQFDWEIAEFLLSKRK